MTKLAFEPHKISKSQFKPLREHVIVKDMSFKERIVGNIILPSDDGKSSGIRPRWAEVYAVGPEQTTIKPGDFVLVEHGRWTRGIEVEDEDGKHVLRRVDPNGLMMVSEHLPQDETLSDKVSG
jgi:co-chaperonin GroES (HSP10)